MRVALFVLLLSSASVCHAQARQSACTKYDETHLNACVSGKERVWAYDTSDPSYGTAQNSGYKTAEAAQRSRDSEEKWCKYWYPRLNNHLSCPTTYGEVYCAACGPSASSRPPLTPEQRVWLEKAQLLLDQWQGQLEDAIKVFTEENPTRNPYANVGSVLADYNTALEDATKDVIRLRRALQPLHAGINSLSMNLQTALNNAQQSQNRLQSAQAAYQRSRQMWSQQDVEINGQHARQIIRISGDSVAISQKDMNGSSQTYVVPKADLTGSNATIRQQGDTWVLSIAMPRRAAKLTINSGPTNYQEVVSRFELFFATEANAQAAAHSLGGR